MYFPDSLLNEFFKHGRNVIGEVLTKLFNVILLSGKIPEAWGAGWIVPIYKKKGSINVAIGRCYVYIRILYLWGLVYCTYGPQTVVRGCHSNLA